VETPPRPDASDRVLALLGLGAAGGNVVAGVDGTRAFLKRQKCFAVVMASDASPRALEKVSRLAAATGIPMVAGPSADRIGQRLGRPPVMVVGVKDRALAAGILAASAPRDGT
jgi:ribosomal protein L7Ae-like RNA K-turn-binding protein